MGVRLLTATLVVVMGMMMMMGVEGVDRSKFKKCSDLGFCRRNRKLSEMEDKKSPYQLDDFFQTGEPTKAATFVNKITDAEYKMSISTYSHNIWRVRMEEMEPLRKRFDVAPLVINEGFLEGDNQLDINLKERGDNHVVMTSSSLASSVTLDKKSNQMTFKLGERELLVLNERGLLSFEETRKAGSAPSYEDWKATDREDGGWEESFSSHKDTKPYGPQSVGMDITFLDSLHAFGLPEHTTRFDLDPTVPEDGSARDPLREPYRFYNLDVFEFEMDETMALYGSIPILISHNEHASVGVVWVNAAETWVDVGKNKDEKKVLSHWISETGYLDVYILLGPSPTDLFRQISSLSGFMELPPLFSIAYHQCRWNYKDEEDVQLVNQGFDEHDIPMDVLWLDIEHTDGKRYFTWDKAHFPTPVKMQKELEDKGRRLVTIVDPHIKRDNNYFVHKEAEEREYYVKDKSGKSFDGWCWPGSSSWLDYLNPEVQGYWAGLFSLDKYEGSTPSLFIWNDMNEPSVFNGPEITMQKDNLHFEGVEHREVHNIYGALCQKSTRQGLIQRDEKRNGGDGARPFSLSRAFFIGSQKLGAIWTGDNAGQWSHLRSAQPMLLSLGVAGMPFVGADVGGFFGNPEPELLLRWYQAGAFQPFFRAHAHIDTKRREPWLFGEPWTSHIRKAIRTRYAYLPYWYTLFKEASVTGVPPMRPLWVEFPGETFIFGEQDTYLVGRSLLVHPIVEAGRSSAQVPLPGSKSRWFDVETYEMKLGGGTIYADAPLEKIPVFQRGGSIIPKRERARRSSTQMKWDPYTLVVALDIQGRAQGSLYVDDMVSYAYTRGASLTIDFEFSNNVLTAIPQKHAGYIDTSVIERVVIMGLSGSKVEEVTLNHDGEKTEVSFVVGSGDALVVRKPFVPIADTWSLVIS